MSLAASLRDAAQSRSGRPCNTCVLVGVLPSKDRVALVLSTLAIWRAIDAEGYDLSVQSLRRHRSGGCLGA